MEVVDRLDTEGNYQDILENIYDYVAYKPTNASIRTAVAEYATDEVRGKEKYGNIELWNTSNVTDMSFLFCQDNVDFNTLGKKLVLDYWNMSNVKNIEAMFLGLKVPLLKPSKWNTRNVENCSTVFSNTGFSGDISRWNTSKVKECFIMFGDNKSDTNPKIRHNLYRKVAKSDVSFGLHMQGDYTKGIEIPRYNNEKRGKLFDDHVEFYSPKDRSEYGVTVRRTPKGQVGFYERKFNFVYNKASRSGYYKPSDQDIHVVVAKYLENPDMKSVFGDINDWDVSSITDMECLFSTRQMFENYGTTPEIILDRIDLSKWDVSNVKNMKCMFEGVDFIRDFRFILEWDMSSVKTTCMMFAAAILKDDLSSLNLEKVKDCALMFGVNGKITNPIVNKNLAHRIWVLDMASRFHLKEKYFNH